MWVGADRGPRGRSSGAVVTDGRDTGPLEVQGAGNCCDISPAPSVSKFFFVFCFSNTGSYYVAP